MMAWQRVVLVLLVLFALWFTGYVFIGDAQDWWTTRQSAHMITYTFAAWAGVFVFYFWARDPEEPVD